PGAFGFFCSSRRRHTRCLSDWSSDVCSSDLLIAQRDSDVYYDMGITLRDQGDLRRAAIAYRHALGLRPDFWEAHSNLGVVLHDRSEERRVGKGCRSPWWPSH